MSNQIAPMRTFERQETKVITLRTDDPAVNLNRHAVMTAVSAGQVLSVLALAGLTGAFLLEKIAEGVFAFALICLAGCAFYTKGKRLKR